jgi:hypothetical protein
MCVKLLPDPGFAWGGGEASLEFGRIFWKELSGWELRVENISALRVIVKGRISGRQVMW